MSKVQEDLVVQLGYNETVMAFRKAAMSLGVIQELGEGHFQIKETDNGYSAGTMFMGSGGGIGFATDKTYNPATSDILIRSVDQNQTAISILVSNFGIGQTKHCNAQLSTIKSAIIVAINKYANAHNSAQQEATAAPPTMSAPQPAPGPAPLIQSIRVDNKAADGSVHNHTVATVFVAILVILKFLATFVYGGWVFWLIFQIVTLVVGAIGIIICAAHIKDGDKAPWVYLLIGIASTIELFAFINFLQYV